MDNCGNSLIEFISQSSGLVFMHINIRSMRANFDSLVVELQNIKHLPKIIILTEIWISSAEIDLYQIPNYKTYSKTNEEYRSGGVAVYLHISLSQYENPLLVQFDVVAADVLMLTFKHNSRVINVLAVYRLHRYAAEIFLDELDGILSNLNINVNKNMFIIGDMNINLLIENRLTDDYKMLLAKYGFESIINTPTRISRDTSTCIDHIFCRIKDRNKVTVRSAVIECDVSDHAITAVWFLDADDATDNNTGSKVMRKIERINQNKLDKLLDLEKWGEVYLQANVSLCFDYFIDRLSSIIKTSSEEVKIHKNNKLKPWITVDVCNKIKKRNNLLKKLRIQPNNECLKTHFKEFRNKLNTEVRTLKHNYYNKKFEQNKKNSRETWKVLNEITGQIKPRTENITLEHESSVVDDPHMVSNIFNEYFITVSEKLVAENKIPTIFHSLHFKQHFLTTTECKSMFLEPVLEYELINTIKSLKNNTAAGIDGISTNTIKQIYSKIVHVLLYIINFSFSAGVFPDRLKQALVIPIHKKNSIHKCSNYRPISLLSVLSKIIEKIMKKRLIAYLNKINFFSKNQFGFREGLNTESALISFMEGVSNGLNSGDSVSGLFLDMTKAFDTVNHSILMSKLHRSGVRGIVYKWFASYLSERKQCVKIGNTVGDFGVMKCGVPQGSVLGPILFLIYVNDLCNGNFLGQLTSFADDTALCYVGKNRTEIELKINKDLEALRWWFTENYMVLNTDKTNYVNFSLRRTANIINKITYKCINCMCLGERECSKCADIKKADNVKYLGIMLDCELNWKKHLAFLKSKIVQILRLFFFLRKLCTTQLMRTIYFSLVHSRLEYGITCWGGTYITNLKPLITCQKIYIRVLTNKHKLASTFPLFKELHILPLRYIFVFKVLRMFFIRSKSIETNEYREKLRNKDHMFVTRPTSTYFTKTFTFLGPSMINKLPVELRAIQSYKYFSSKLRNWLFSIENIEDYFYKI